MKLCDNCKRVLEDLHAWTSKAKSKPILFHGKNMNNGFHNCWNNPKKGIPMFTCIINLIEKLAQDDETETIDKQETTKDESENTYQKSESRKTGTSR